jgi:hypothetical protein
MLRNGGRFASLLLGAGALWWLAREGILPPANPFRPHEFIIEQDELTPKGWRELMRREDVMLCLTWFFVTAGPTTTLPSDFNIASNQVNLIGNGAGGQGGTSGSVCGGGSCSGSGSTCSGGGTNGNGGPGGGGGAFAEIVNYSAHGAGAVVNVNFTGDVWFDTSATVLAKSASGQTGGQASASIGTTTFSGGNGGTANIGGGGGGGAGGPHGQGNNGANTPGGLGAGVGGAGDAGNTAGGSAGAGLFGGNGGPGGNGTQFPTAPATGPGGGGGAGTGNLNNGGQGGAGGQGGKYGGGGGGGGGGAPGGSGGNGGNAFQGLIGISYTPASGGGGGTPRSFGVFIT